METSDIPIEELVNWKVPEYMFDVLMFCRSKSQMRKMVSVFCERCAKLGNTKNSCTLEDRLKDIERNSGECGFNLSCFRLIPIPSPKRGD